MDAYIELAKYYEHHQRDYTEAMHWTQTAIQVTGQLDLPYWRRRVLLEEFNHRLERLQNKLAVVKGSGD